MGMVLPLRFTLRQLAYFVVEGDEGPIAGASNQVKVSSSAISAAISQLEAELNLPLFVRKHADGLNLIQTGQQFLDLAIRVLKEAQSLN